MPLLLKQVLDAALDFIFPINCLNCGSEGAFICHNCFSQLPWLHPPCCLYCAQPSSPTPCRWCRISPLGLEGSTAPFVMEGPIKEAVLQLKYHQVRGLTAVLAGLMENAWRSKGLSVGLVLPVPLHPRRLRQRGYNQSELLAKALGKGLGLPCDPSLLVRTRDTPPQVGLGRDDRVLNVQNSFHSSEAVSGKSVLIVDDVATTGSTLSACADALRKSGVTSVHALVLAREGHPSPKDDHASRPFHKPWRG